MPARGTGCGNISIPTSSSETFPSGPMLLWASVRPTGLVTSSASCFACVSGSDVSICELLVAAVSLRRSSSCSSSVILGRYLRSTLVRWSLSEEHTDTQEKRHQLHLWYHTRAWYELRRSQPCIGPISLNSEISKQAELSRSVTMRTGAQWGLPPFFDTQQCPCRVFAVDSFVLVINHRDCPRKF